MSHESPLHVVVGVIKNAAGEILIARRGYDVHQGGLWEFPGGKVEPGETVIQALTRELQEEININVDKISPIIKIKHNYSDLSVLLDVWSVDVFYGPVMACEGQPIKWVHADGLGAYTFPTANLPIINALRLPQYYAILDGNDVEKLTKDLHLIVAGGVKLLQLRMKSLPAELVEEFLSYAYPFCKKNGVWVLLNSAVEQAFSIHVDGLHVTSRDLRALTSRPAELTWVAASCHNLGELQQAENMGLDFAVLAPVMHTSTHPEAEPMGWDMFAKMVDRVNIPVFALGGMELTDAARARSLGGQGVAGIRMFLDQRTS